MQKSDWISLGIILILIGIIISPTSSCVKGEIVSNYSMPSLPSEKLNRQKEAISNGDCSQTWEWAKSGGGQQEDVGRNIAVDNAGNIYVVGEFFGNGTATFGNTTLTGHGDYDFFVLALNPSGSWRWAVSGGEPGRDTAWGGIALDSTGNIYVSGCFNGNLTLGTITLIGDPVRSNLYIARLSPSGSWEWAVQVQATVGVIPDDIALDSANNIYITGVFFGSVTFGTIIVTENGGGDVFVAKLASDGTWQWATHAGATDYDQATAIAVDGNGNVYVTGWFDDTATFGNISLTSQGIYDLYVASLSPSGSWRWAVSAGGINNDIAYGIAVDTEGNSYVTGWFQGNATFGGILLTSEGEKDGFVAKLSSFGGWLWAVNAGETGSKTHRYENGDFCVLGYFTGNATFGNTILKSKGGRDIYLGTVNADGAWQWAVSGGGPNNEDGLGLGVTPGGDPVVTGWFWNTTMFGNTTLIAQGDTDVFIAKLGLTYPPEIPSTPVGSAWGWPNTNYTFSSSTIDPDGDQVYYQWGWGDGTQSSWFGPYSSGERINVSHSWATKGIYEIRVKAKDVYDEESQWSEPFTTEMLGTQPTLLLGIIKNRQAYENYYLFNPVVLIMFPSDSVIVTSGTYLLKTGYHGYLGRGLVVAMGEIAVLPDRAR